MTTSVQTGTPTEPITGGTNGYVNNSGTYVAPTNGLATSISADTLSTNSSPLNVPTVSPTSSITPVVSPPMGTTVGSNGVATSTAPTDSSSDTQGWIRSQLAKLGGALGGKSGATVQAQNDVNLAQKTTQATSDYNAYAQAKLDLAQKLDTMRSSNPAGEFGGARSTEIATAEREGNANLANLAVVAQSSQGLLDAAQKTITDKINAQFQPIQDQIDFLTKFSTVNNNDLTDSEKQDLTAKADQMKTDKADVSKFSNDIHSNLMQNKAPISVYSAIDKITNDFTSGKITAADAKNQIAQASGSYAGDAYKTAQTAKLNADAIAESVNSGDSTTSIIDGNGNAISVPTSAAPYVGTSSSGVNYIDASTLQGTSTQKNKIVNEAQASGLKVITNKNSVLDLTNIKDANSKLDTATSLLNDISQPDALARDLGGYGLTQLGVLAQTNPKAAIAQSVPIIGLDILKAISGVQGFRGNQAAIQQVQDHLPKPTDTAEVVKGKVEFIKNLLNDREDAIVGKPTVPSISTSNTSINGLSVTLPDRSVWTAPSQEALDSFKKDHGLK